MDKGKLPMMSNLDMEPIYRKILLDIEDDKTSAFVIFDNQPFDLAHFSLPNGNSLIYLNNCENVADKIIDEIKNGGADEDAPEFAVHSLSNKEVGTIYTMAILISEMLDIPCPQIELRDNYDNYGSSVGERNFVVLRAASGDAFGTMIYALSHELRHLWQYKNRPEYYDVQVSYEASLEEYFNSPAELDAEAFANALNYAITGINQLDHNDKYAMGNESVKQKTRDIMDSIKFDEDILYRIKGILGYID